MSGRALLRRTVPLGVAAACAIAAGSVNAARPAPARHLLVTIPRQLSGGWTAVAAVRGHQAAWEAVRGTITLLRFDQRYVHLALHAGWSDGGVTGWTYGDKISSREIHLVVAAFNGGFKLSYRDVGFASGTHVAVPLKAGLASVVTYTDGTTDIGAWRNGVPSRRKRVFSVLQNQALLVDHGVAASTVATCVIACWGDTVYGLTNVPRSGLGITAAGQLVWAAGGQLSPAMIAAALVGAGAVRAAELDINPYAVAGYLYVHRASGPEPVPLIKGQLGIPGQWLVPYSRDFFTVVAN